MLTVALPHHLDLVARIVESGAAAGSWDCDLATPGSARGEFLAKLQHAFVYGYLPQIDPRTGQHLETRIGGYVYLPDDGAQPVGFGLFKDFTETGFELWLVGIAEHFQGRGHGRRMLDELLSTPMGTRVELARCALASAGGRLCSHILKTRGFTACRSSATEEWLLHDRTPAAVVQLIKTMDLTPFRPASDPRGNFGESRSPR